MSAALRFAPVAAALLAIAVTPPLFAALDAAQKQTLATAEKGLTQIETNLKLAQDAAGPATAAVQGAKARLVQTRLAQATAPLDQVKQLLAPLPADEAQVVAARKRLDAITAAVAALEARLGAPAAPAASTAAPAKPGAAPAAKTPAAPAAKEARLDYKQEQLAKDARSYLSEIEGLANGESDVVKKVQPAKDPLTVEFQLVQSAANSITKGRQRAELVKGRLDQLPEGGQGVSALVAQYQELIASLDASDKIIGPLYKKLSALVDPASYPEFEADFRRIQQLTQMFQNADLSRNIDRAVALVQQTAPAEADVKRLATTYAPIVQQKTDQGERFDKMVKYFQESHAAFTAAATKTKHSLPAEIDADLAKAGKLANQAVAEKKPAFFSGGIPNQLGYAERKLVLLAALDSAAATASKTKLEAAKKQLQARAASLRDAIVSTNELPPSRYKGRDKANLEKLAIETWKKNDPKAVVLGVRFPSEQWDRETLLRWENRAWHPIDRSKLQAQVIVKQDNKLAVIRPITLITDHLNSDKLTASPMDDIKEELPPHRFLLVEKIK